MTTGKPRSTKDLRRGSNVHVLSGTVAGGSQTGVVAGGLVAKNEGVVENSSSAVDVSAGTNSIVGGFAGLNGGPILLSTSSGTVTATSESYLGGFAGVNLGTIQSSRSLAAVNGIGNHNIMGGFVGANFGSLDGSSSAGTASGSTNSAVGGFAGANAQFINFAAGSIPSSSFPVGTITNSAATGAATAGQGSTVDPFIALNIPTSASNLPAFSSILTGCSNPLCGFLNTGILPPAGSLPPAVSLPPAGSLPPPDALLPPAVSLPLPVSVPPTRLLSPFSPEFPAALPGAVQVINNLVGQGPSQFAALNAAAPVFDTVLGGIRLPQQQQALGPPGAQQGQPPQPPVGFASRIIDIPPPTETRFIKDEVVLQIAGNVTVERLEAAVGRLGLTRLASEKIGITGSTVARFRITEGRSPAEIIPALAAIQLVAVAQPNYVYTLQQQTPARDPTMQGDPAQYIVEKLKIVDVHRMVRGTNVPIAVIDLQIDVTHPDLEGRVAQRFSAVGAAEKPDPHGTGMAGAIAAHKRLLVLIGKAVPLRSDLGSNRREQASCSMRWLIPHHRAYHDAASFLASPGPRMSTGKAGLLDGPPHDNSKAASLQPGDEVGAYAFAKPIHRRYVAAAEQAVCFRLLRPPSAVAEQRTGASDRARHKETGICGGKLQWARIGLIMLLGSWHDALAADQLPQEIVGNWCLAIERMLRDVFLSSLQRQQLPYHRAPGRLRRAGDQLRNRKDRASRRGLAGEPSLLRCRANMAGGRRNSS